MLEWAAAGDRPSSCLPAFGGYPPGGYPPGGYPPGGYYPQDYPQDCLQDLEQTLSPCGTRLEVQGGIRALTERGLAGAVERVMRGVSDAAAVSGAVLEMRVLREALPRGLRPDLVQALAVDLWRAGFPVRLAPCWDAVVTEGLALGARGGDEGLREFLRDHPVWGPS